MVSAGWLMPEAIVWFGQSVVVDGRRYRHDLSSVPVEWAIPVSGWAKDQAAVRKAGVLTLYSSEMLEDAGLGRQQTWSEREAEMVRHNRLGRRLRRAPRLAWARVRYAWRAFRIRLADILDPDRATDRDDW